MPMTPLPTLDRTSATFKTDVDDFFATDLPTFVSEANALETAVDADKTAAAASASAASSSASAANISANEANAAASSAVAVSGATVWISGTTYALYDTVISPSDYQTYRRKIAGAGTTDPSADYTNWERINSLPSQNGNAGKTLTTDGTSASWSFLGAIAPSESITTNTTLTSTSSGYQIISDAITADLTITLPDATTLPGLSFSYIIQNDSYYYVTIQNNNGDFLTIVPPKITKSLSLADNSTANGLWKRVFETNEEQDRQHIDLQNEDIVFNINTTTYISSTQLDTDKVLVCYRDDSTGYGMACIISSSGNTLSASTPVAFTASTITDIETIALSTTQAIVAYLDGSLKSMVLDIDGTTITTNTATTVYSGSNYPSDIVKISTTQAVVVFLYGTDTKNYASVLDVTGSSITAQTPVAIQASGGVDTDQRCKIAVLSASQLIAVYRNSSNHVYTRLLGLSGSTLTTQGSETLVWGTASGLAGYEPVEIHAVSSSQCLVFFTEVNSYETGMCLLNITGTTILPDKVYPLHTVSNIAYGFNIIENSPSSVDLYTVNVMEDSNNYKNVTGITTIDILPDDTLVYTKPKRLYFTGGLKPSSIYHRVSKLSNHKIVVITGDAFESVGLASLIYKGV